MSSIPSKFLTQKFCWTATCREWVTDRGTGWLAPMLSVLWFCLVSPADAQLTSNCVVSVLNQTARVQADGTWTLPNVPAGFGLVRVRATCVENGVTRSGQSEYFNISANRMNAVLPFSLGNATPIPSSLAITSAITNLNSLGATAQLTVTATYPDNSTKNVTPGTSGTSYTVSNPKTATISPDGLVTAKQSGVVVISAINEGAIGFFRVSVILAGVDSRGDGIPDALLIANGLDPNDPNVAQEDPDHDGLNNYEELMIYGTDPHNPDTDGDGISDGDEVHGTLGYVTNPLLADSDGDGIRDLLEIQTGSNPTNAASYNLAAALQSLEVQPNNFVLTVNTIIGTASRQLSVIGHLKDGTTIDLTSTTRRTVYSSDNLFVANFGSPDGNIFAGTNGTATITISNSTFVATALVTVRTSTPQALGFVAIPGFANAVGVAGNYAYVAAGATGLQVVDVTDHSNPRVVAALDTPGNAEDVRVVGGLAYVADGSGGLRIISVANPLSPVLVGVTNITGDAQDVDIVGSRAFVADGSSGLRIIDVSTPSNPRLVSTLSTLGAAVGVDVSGSIAVVAEGTAGIQVVDITDPANPSVLGTLTGGDVRDVVIKSNYVFAADHTRSFTVIDITDRRNPKLKASTAQNLGGLPQDLAVDGQFALAAEVYFVNGIPIIDISNPTNPVPRAILDFSAFRDDNGTGIAVDGSYVYLTTEHSSLEGKGTTGDSRLYIGQYLAIQDTRGIPPLVAITSPTNGTTAIEGTTITVHVNASDDVGVASVSLLVNGVSAGSVSVAPYDFPVTVPVGVNSLALQARAVDYGANTTLSAGVNLTVIPDPLTTVVGRVVDQSTNGVAGATVAVFNTYSNITLADGSFSISGVPTIRGSFYVVASTTITNALFNGSSASFAPVPGGTVNVGSIVISPIQNQGKEFIVAFMRNYDDGLIYGEPLSLSLFVSGQSPTLGTVEIPGLLFSTNFVVTPGVVTTVPIPTTAVLSTSDGVARLGVHITADQPVSVYGLNRELATTDAFTGLPVETFGTRYRPMCYVNDVNQGNIGQSEFAVVASVDSTTVTITPRATAGSRTAGVPFQVTLNRFDAYQLGATASGADLTGSLITSDKPIGVFGGNACAFVPSTYYACDHVCEEMPPTDTWGQDMLTVPLATRLNGDTFRIMADQDGTTVTIRGPSPFTTTLAAGQFVERILTGANEISANKPILVAQFSNGTTYDNVVSDPFMMLVPPAEQFLRSYTFATPNSGFRTNAVNIVAPTADAQAGAVVLDGHAVSASRFTSISGTAFSSAQVGILLGSHTISGPNPIGIYVYGFDQADSYGYPGGMALVSRGVNSGSDTNIVPPAIAQSIARVWDEQTLSAIRIDTPNPPVQARNLFSVSAAMYDAWAAYDPGAVGYVYHDKHTADDIVAARSEAISYAAYRLLRERYVYSKSAATTLAALDANMVSLGYDPSNVSLDTSTPAGVGNNVYAAVSAWFINDGCYETNAYQDLPPGQGGYVPVNPPCVTGTPGTTVVDVNRWQPLAIANAVDQNGFPAGPIQKFLGAQWLGVRPYALTRTDSSLPWVNPGPQPRLGGAGDAQFRNEVVDVIRRSSQLTPDDGATIDISPGAYGNNSLGANDGTGHPLNPATGLPYAPNIVPRGDLGRVLAEFWADGPNSETPPGHWNVIANSVADNTNFVKRIGGTGPVVDDLEWDVKVYFALNAGVHDAACAAWSLKRYYDGGRPISYIRYMGELGQSSQPSSPSYNPNGLPLVSNLVELVTSATAGPGGRHQGLPVGKVVIYAWPGQPASPANQHSGARWILPENWLPYQKSTFVTPSFPGYASGHSSFSRAAAEVLAAITGSPYFPGGLGTYTAPANAFLSFEHGPSQTVQLQWATYFDASDQAGQSRLWGGIHVSVDDLTGRILGAQCGSNVWALARPYYDGTISNTPILLSIRPLGTNRCEVRFNTLRGFYYGLQSSPSLSQPFTDEPPGLIQALDTSVASTNSPAGPAKFYRVVRTLSP